MEQDSQSQSAIKWTLGLAGLGAAAPFVVLNDKKQAVLIALVIILLLALLLGGYLLWLHWQRKKARGAFNQFAEQGALGAPTGVDAKGLAELDGLRKKFQEGLQAYRNNKKDLYSLPWYAVVGEPSSGKSEAVRHCGISFPPGLTDPLQGSGGTINMHWWFTNNGVILDTAGKMLFANVKPGESNLWQEFLRMLKKARPYCPINGLLLVLPVDSLIKDNANKINEKAVLIARQLDVIQRALDVRFPVFVVVTKCDLLTGFREFFEGLDDIEATQQILGWSNPDPLDAPFQPELVDQHLEQVAQRLRRRRLAMRRDPTETGPHHSRRTDAVDSLFALPQSLLLIVPRLRLYLKTIFVAGEWAAKPVFLRGIYFTSSLRQGSPLDEALAALRGVPVSEMYGEASEEKEEKTFFLYDLFIEKIFRERGLVTRATNTLALLRRRRWTLLGFGSAALLLWAGVSAFFHHRFQRSIGAEAATWAVATNSNAWTKENFWHPVVYQTNSPGSVLPAWHYAGNDAISNNWTLEQFHVHLRKMAVHPSPVPIVFRPAGFLLRGLNRSGAQEVLFERGVVMPLLDGTRLKMSQVPPTEQMEPAAETRHAQALLSLIQLESDLSHGRQTIPKDVAEKYVDSLVGYLTETNLAVSNNLVPLFAEMYSRPRRDRRAWLPPEYGPSVSLASSASLSQGLTQFLLNAKHRTQQATDHFKLLTNVLESAKRFRDQEAKLLKAAENPSTAIVVKLLTEVGQARTNLDSALQAAEGSLKLPFPGQPGYLLTNYESLQKQIEMAVTGPLKSINDAVSVETGGVLKEIAEKLRDYSKEARKPFVLDSTDLELLPELDTNFLAQYATKRHYAHRADLYQDVANYRTQKLEVTKTLGDKWKTFLELKANAQTIARDAKDYKGAYANTLLQICQELDRVAEQELTKRWIGDYALIVKQKMAVLDAEQQVNLGFLDKNANFLRGLGDDLAKPEIGKLGLPPELQAQLTELAPDIDNTKKGLIARYVKYKNGELSKLLGFPVVWDSAILRNYVDLKWLRDSVEATKGELSADVFKLLAENQKQPLLEELANNLSKISSVVDPWIGDGKKVPTVTIQMDNKIDPIRGRFRRVAMAYGNIASAGVFKDVGIPAAGQPEMVLNKFPLDQLVRIDVQGPEGQITSIFKGGVIEWLKASKAPVLRDGCIWRVPLPVRDTQVQGELFIEIKMELDPGRSLPSSGEWPSKATLSPLDLK